MSQLSGKTALVSGAARGIGLAIAGAAPLTRAVLPDSCDMAYSNRLHCPQMALS